jgi:hypothetical protein
VICRVSTGAGENCRKEGEGGIKKMKISDRIDRIRSNPIQSNPVYPVNPVKIFDGN